MPRREIEITTQRFHGCFRAWMTDDSHNEVTRNYERFGATRAEAFERCREYAQGSQISLVGRTAAWWHYNAEAGRPMCLEESVEWDAVNLTPMQYVDEALAECVMLNISGS
jgi:hypothetical protein